MNPQGKLLFYNYLTLTHDRLSLYQAEHLSVRQGAMYIPQNDATQARYRELIAQEFDVTIAMRMAIKYGKQEHKQ